MNHNADTWMRRALELAERGRGHVEPNPLVGAVLVKDGHVVGEGWHEKFGQAHAEINALKQAGEQARGATLYVTLEPCCHHGKTPPCTDAIIRAGIKDVIAAIEDPFPQVAGRGAAQLQSAGIPISFGPGAADARILNAPYLKLLRTGRPYVHAKWAMSLDGKIATRSGHSQWISNEASRRQVHALRGRVDAIVVGIGTALADDPLLTARPPGPRQATRVVLDSRARLPLAAQLVKTARDCPVLIVVAAEYDQSPEAEALRGAGCEVMAVGCVAGKLGLGSWLSEMGRRRWTNILVEGGGQVLGALRDIDAIDETHVFVAARLLGGAAAPSAMAGYGADHVDNATPLDLVTVQQLEGDVYVHCRRRYDVSTGRS